MRRFEVVGSVLGEDGERYSVVGAELAPTVIQTQPPAGGGAQRLLQLPPKPDWRRGELAPGVQAHDEGMVPLPMMPLTNGGTFTASISSIMWQGQLQKPFRAERLLVSVVRTGSSAVGRLLGQFFVGTDLQQADLSGLDIELIGATTAFGTRMTLIQAPPGVLIRVPVTLSSPLTTSDTIYATMMFLGRWIH
jgi:hypothetical protein